MNDQKLMCTNKLQECTYSCSHGLKSNNNKDTVKKCQLDGTWSGPDLKCGMSRHCHKI